MVKGALAAKVSILIANWNTRDYLRGCLISVAEAPGICETIVVDNASTDGSADMLHHEFPWVILVENEQNLGFGNATNQAVRLAHGEFFLLLNPDAILCPGTLSSLLSFLEDHPMVGAIGPRILNPDGSLQVSCSPKPTLTREAWRLFWLDGLCSYSRYPQQRLDACIARATPFPVDVLLGACILIRRQAAEQVSVRDPVIPNRSAFDDATPVNMSEFGKTNLVGLFDEQFFVYSEEVDLCLRIQKVGWQIIWLPTVDVIHYGGQSTRQAATQMFLELYKGKVKYFRKHRGARSAQIYKAILYCASLARWLPGALLSGSPPGQDRGWGVLSKRYRILLDQLNEY